MSEPVTAANMADAKRGFDQLARNLAKQYGAAVQSGPEEIKCMNTTAKAAEVGRACDQAQHTLTVM